MSYNPYQFGAIPGAQQRFGQMPTNYTTQFQTAQQAPQMPLQAVGQQTLPSLRFVSSREELAASQIPFDGSTSWFYNTAADTIHSKTFDFNTGMAPIVTYVREQQAPAVKYVTSEELNGAVAELRKELDALRPRKAGKRNEQSDVSDE